MQRCTLHLLHRTVVLAGEGVARRLWAAVWALAAAWLWAEAALGQKAGAEARRQLGQLGAHWPGEG